MPLPNTNKCMHPHTDKRTGQKHNAPIVGITKCSHGYPVVAIVKPVVVYYSQLTVKDRSADKWFGINLVLSSPAYPPSHSPMSSEWQRSAAAANTSDLVGIGVCNKYLN